MSRLLAFDTSTDRLTVGVYEMTAAGPSALAELESTFFTRHSEALAPAIRRVLDQAEVGLEDLDCIAVGLGPGSFTGLRVGITTAKLLAYAARLKVVGIPSLKAIAYGVRGCGVGIAVMADARKDMVYAALYEEKSGALRERIGPHLVSADIFLRRVGGRALFLGDAVERYREHIKKIGASRFEMQAGVALPRASAIAGLASEAFRKGRFLDPVKLEPLYLYPRDCNVTGRRPVGRH